MLGSLVAAGSSLLGGLFSSKNADKQANLQREFAQNALQWKAADAEKAGVSKIFAMGAPTVSYSPVSTGDSGISAAGAALGKGIDSQVGPHGTTTGKISGIQAQIQSAQLDGLKIDNDIKRAELASKIGIATQPGAGGTMDRDVIQGPDGVKLKKEIAPAGHSRQKTFGSSPEVDLYATHSGDAPQVPQALQEAFENDALGRWQWNLRNRIMPMWDMDAYGTPRNKTGHFLYNPLTGQYEEYESQRGRPRDVKGLYDRLRR